MVVLGYWGYLSAAASFLVLTLLLLTSWRGRLQGGILVLSVVTSVVWGVVHSSHIMNQQFSPYIVWSVETLRTFFWITFLFRLLNPDDRIREGISRYWVIAYLLLAAMLLLPFDLRQVDNLIFLYTSIDFDIRYFSHVLLALTGVILLEQVYRNTKEQSRWGIKYLIIGLGGIFIYDLYLFVDALLFHRLNPDIWYARGLVNLIMVPLIGVSAARNPKWSLDVFVSRKIIFHTTGVFIIGVYMLLMALGGYYIQIYGGDWGGVVAIIFISVSVVTLIILVTSGRIRAIVKVFFNKHFFSYRYDYREEWLRLIADLSGKNSQLDLYQRVIKAIAQIVDSQGGYLFVIKPDNEVNNCAAWNSPALKLPHNIDYQLMVGLLEKRQWVVNFDEETSDVENRMVPSAIRSIDHIWIIVPLLHEYQLVGFVILLQAKARHSLNWENMDLLKTSGQQAASYISQFLAAEALAEAKQFEGFNRLSAFVMHDLKNLIAQLSLVSKNAVKHKHNPEFIDDAMLTIDNSVGRMSRLLNHLSNVPDEGMVGRCDLLKIVSVAVSIHSHQKPIPVLDAGNVQLTVMADKERLTAVLGHIMQNAQDATNTDGDVNVKIGQEDDWATITVSDNGSGMSDDFVQNRLFRPFDSTKGLTGMGIGAYESREVIKELGGDIRVTSELGVGSVFIIRLPVVYSTSD